MATVVTDGNGYITSPLEPWKALKKIGTLTSWPLEKAEALQSISMKCQIHGYRCAIAKKRRDVSAEDLLRWLHMAEIPPPGATKEEKLALRATHIAAWREPGAG